MAFGISPFRVSASLKASFSLLFLLSRSVAEWPVVLPLPASDGLLPEALWLEPGPPTPCLDWAYAGPPRYETNARPARRVRQRFIFSPPPESRASGNTVLVP